MRLFLIAIFFLQLSCSSTHFKSSNNADVSFKKLENQTEKVEVIVEKRFYLWGLYPEKQIVEVDSEFISKGYDSLSGLEIKEIKISKRVMWGILTLGMYYPKTYSLQGNIPK